ncbi:MAG: hypothetical protein M3O15_05495 [Acidobacteriota bacterium]|nr:hypothetical protein [Acidobacteriota bacterium]
MKLTIRDGVLTVEDATVDEAVELAARLRQTRAGFSPASHNGADGESAPEPTGSRGRPVSALDSPRIPTANKREALLRFYEEIQIDDHKKMLRVLAAAGNKGLDQDQLKKRAGVTKGLAGFGNSITKRTRAYGLKKADVLIVDLKGTFAQKRRQIYRLSTEMLEVMREQGFVEHGAS